MLKQAQQLEDQIALAVGKKVMEFASNRWRKLDLEALKMEDGIITGNIPAPAKPAKPAKVDAAPLGGDPTA